MRPPGKHPAIPPLVLTLAGAGGEIPKLSRRFFIEKYHGNHEKAMVFWGQRWVTAPHHQSHVPHPEVLTNELLIWIGPKAWESQ